MAYYYFNNCPEGKVGELARFLGKSRMVEVEAASPVREWRKDDSRSIWLAEYDPRRKKTPLLFQTHLGVDYRNPEVLEIMRGIIPILEASAIYEGHDCSRTLPMDTFKNVEREQRR